MKGLVLGLALLTVLATSCIAPREGARAPSSDPGRDAARSSLPGAGTPSPPVANPTHYLVETELYELPLALAEELYGRADERETTIGTQIDQAQCRAALALLAPTNPAIVHTRRADLELEIGELELVPMREPGTSSKADKPDFEALRLASDYLGLEVRLTRSDGWAPLELETRMRWTDPKGRVLGLLPSAASPLPEGAWMQLVCLPSRSEAAAAKTPALFAFLRVTPRWDRVGRVPSPR